MGETILRIPLLDELNGHHGSPGKSEGEKDKTATAKIFLDEDVIDNTTIRQVLAMMQNPSLRHIRVMPDCHVGQGCCVGFTALINPSQVVPSFVGGDIGCGILTYPLQEKRLNLKKLEAKIKQSIPSGVGWEHMHPVCPVELSYIERYLEQANQEVQATFTSDGHLHGSSTAASLLKEAAVVGHLAVPLINMEYFVTLCDTIGIDFDVCVKSFGTLGGGNHFIEVNVDDGEENLDLDRVVSKDEATKKKSSSKYYVTVHSGSRSFGMKLFEYHNKKKAGSPYLNADDSISYCIDMILAQHLARMNRHIMLQLILREISPSTEFIPERIIESVHNYIDFSAVVDADHESNTPPSSATVVDGGGTEKIVVHGGPVLRKGAISAKLGEKCVLALNMRDGILLCSGKGNTDWNCSSAHGCGRIMSRSEARRSITMKQYTLAMQEVVSTSVAQSTLDEAPQAYKDVQLIMRALEPSVHIEKRLKTVLNVKGTD